MPDDARTTTDYREEAPSAGRRSCSATRRDGQPCQAPAVRAHADPAATGGRAWFCQAHDPARDPAAAREASARGGRNRANAVRAVKSAPESLQGLLTALYGAVVETRDGTISPSQATALANLSSSIVKAVEVASLEAQMAELRAALAPQRPVSRPALPDRPERAAQFAPLSTIARDEGW